MKVGIQGSETPEKAEPGKAPTPAAFSNTYFHTPQTLSASTTRACVYTLYLSICLSIYLSVSLYIYALNVTLNTNVAGYSWHLLFLRVVLSAPDSLCLLFLLGPKALVP